MLLVRCQCDFFDEFITFLGQACSCYEKEGFLIDHLNQNQLRPY